LGWGGWGRRDGSGGIVLRGREEADVEGDAFSFVAGEGDGVVGAFRDANAAAHAFFPVQLDGFAVQGEGTKGAGFDAGGAGGAEFLVDLGDVA